MLKFLNYMRYRSWGLLSLFAYLIWATQDAGIAIIALLFVAHSYLIYRREDGGINHLEIIQQLKNLRASQEKNQLELIELIKKIV